MKFKRGKATTEIQC